MSFFTKILSAKKLKLGRPVLCFVFCLFWVCHFSQNALANTKIDVRFTNPSCPGRPYKGYVSPVEIKPHESGSGIYFAKPLVVSSSHVPLRSGQETRSTTKEGAFCFPQDAAATDERADSVFQKLKELIESQTAQDKIQISTFSFSNKAIFQLLCTALERGVELEIITGSASALADDLASGRCGGNKARLVKGEGTSGRLQHTKFIIFTDPNTQEATLSFQSANISSGVNLHQENWTFVESTKNDAFVQKHICQFESLKNAHFNATINGLSTYRSHYQDCLKDIRDSTTIGIEAFFVPAVSNGTADGKRAIDALVGEMAQAEEIDIISHHLTNRQLLDAAKSALGRGKQVRVIMDSELYWVGNSAIPRNTSGAPLYTTSQGFPLLRDKTGLTVFDHYGTVAKAARSCDRGASFTLDEYNILQDLVTAGAEVRYFEANHRAQFFQHNKFLVMRDNQGSLTVFTGAGNFSQAGFNKNGENYYLIKEKSAALAFAQQYDRLWNNIATKPLDLPITWLTQVEGDNTWDNWSAKALQEKRRICP